MRLTVTVETSGEASIPLNYNYLLSSLIYDNLPERAAFLHESGFPYEKRKFKLFTFSRLKGKYSLKDRNMIFNGKLDFVFSTAINNTASDFAKSIIGKESVRLGSTELKTVSVYVHEEPEFSNRMFIRTLSPITIYSTLLTPDGKKKTYYYSPYEKEFSALIDKNVRKKYFVIHKKENNGSSLEIFPVGRQREVVVNYKGTIVKGWMGIFELKGNADLTRVAYDAGIGGKNPEGFGCFEVIKVISNANGA